ncbi:alpha-glucuronidase family glycosyl hydrolase [Mucilaginibacter sp. PAMB04274]|uniref:alpha-d-galacturonidase n=1 Tax=Mucilaginibacter sp. PAMB04274 TaxID=3138568 RepID=UPI0031F6CA72
MTKILQGFFAGVLCLLIGNAGMAKINVAAPKAVTIVTPAGSHVRITFGAAKLAKALSANGYQVKTVHQMPTTASATVVIGRLQDVLIKNSLTKYKLKISRKPGKEGFAINTGKNTVVVAGTDNSGVLYGCMELAERIAKQGGMPAALSLTDQPEMVMRGACVGVQKPVLLEGRGTYEYPYTPENFPWFYDKALWLRYLDTLAQNRMNALYLWNGHPFASLVRVKEYPYAVEVDEATFKKNEEMYKFLTDEADKRGIWVIQMFYNIIVSKPFAVKNNLKTQDRNRPIVPIIADYTRKSIAAFVQKYPNVGLMVALGEAMEGVGQDDIDWFTKTIIPGVKDGLKALGKTEEPPIVLRAHDTDAPAVMKAALPLYKNLYTEAKFNGEALTTYTPHGAWADLHRTLSRIGTVQIENVHILANLEPFRYGSADFIQKSVLAMHNVYEANGLHLYPQASYWDWPYSADKRDERLIQIDRDWIWYKEWARYAWNCHRSRSEEVKYWSAQLAAKFGCTQAQGGQILKAYEESGEISPQILRRVGITDGNRQTMTLGMLMAQFTNPEKFGLFSLLYESEAPEGEILSQYAEKEWKHEPHRGETPMDVLNNIVTYGKKSVDAIEQASPGVTKDKEEFSRLKNDMYCYNAMANSYSHKIRAAISILRYKYSDDVTDLDKALPDMELSLNHFRELVKLTKDSYLYANSMQTRQRKIPVPGTDGKMKTWAELLPVYEQELANFKKNIDSLKSPESKAKKGQQTALVNAQINLISGGAGTYTIGAGARPFADTAATITEFAKELQGLKGVQLDRTKQFKEGTAIKFNNAQPVKVLVGYFNKGGFINPDTWRYALAPQLEIDASANDYGQADVKLSNGILIPGQPSVSIHTYSFKAGTNTLTLPKGIALVLGFVTESQVVPVYDAGFSNVGNIKDLRWLFN